MELLFTTKPLLKVELLLEDMLAVRVTPDLGADAGVIPPPPEAASGKEHHAYTKLKADGETKVARDTSILRCWLQANSTKTSQPRILS